MLSTLCMLLAITAWGTETGRVTADNVLTARTFSRPVNSSPMVYSLWRVFGDTVDRDSDKRGFRFGSRDRFGHGFGKRDDGDGETVDGLGAGVASSGEHPTDDDGKVVDGFDARNVVDESAKMAYAASSSDRSARHAGGV
jgi:hypothetical protein